MDGKVGNSSACFAVMILLVAWFYRQDTAQMHWFWRLWLFGLRGLVLVGLLLIALDPEERTETKTVRPSRVALLIDSSLSMSFPEKTQVSSAPAENTSALTRAQAVEQLLEKSPLIKTLRSTHDVSVFSFDSRLQQQSYLPKIAASTSPSSPDPPGAQTANSDRQSQDRPDWAAIVKPRGQETRLGEALVQLIREAAGETLAGIGVISDGGNNAGIQPETAHEAALAAKVRVLTIGVGSTERPINLQLATVQAPTHVHVGDNFTITAFIQGQGLTGREVHVELLGKGESDAGEPSIVQSRDVTLLEDGVPVTAAFDVLPTEPGRRIFNVRVRPVNSVHELTLVDNEKPLPPVEVIERKTKILVVAGGPMRDYQFVRNLLFRDPSIELDVWLQTGNPGISQESTNLLFSFPSSREELFKYDVIMAFDANWGIIPSEHLQMLGEWVFQQAGGMIFVAGDVYTPELASAKDELKTIQTLIPVLLNSNLYQFEFHSEDYLQPWPIELTREGQEAEFLQLTPDRATSAGIWKQFAGVYRCYPTGGPKAGTTVYAHYSDPRAVDDNGKPILLASQFYGSGRTLYLGSAEMWRLRTIGEEYYDRFWIKAVREVGQGRLLRGTNRGLLLLERSTYPLGTTVQVRATLLDPQFRELVADRIPLAVFDPSGKPLVPGVQLLGNAARPGQFQGAFPANLPGRYRLELPIPDSKDQVVNYVQVELPNLEFDKPEQDDALLKRVATTELGGRYLSLSEAAAAVPQLLTDHSMTKTQFDMPRPLWDRSWVLYLLVGVLSLEWLTRKLLKLA